jgi:hypothetical protein
VFTAIVHCGRGRAVDEDPIDELSSHGRDPRFSDGRMVVLLLVGAFALFVTTVAALALWIIVG